MTESGSTRPDAAPLDRVRLYDAVWTEPATVVAARYGVSGRGLAKLCARNRIPVPGRGYWARVNAGQRPPRLPLPALAAEPRGGEPPILLRRSADPAPVPPPPAAVVAARAREAAADARIVVPSEAAAVPRVHPAVAAWKRTWRSREGGAGGSPSLDVRVSDAQRGRALLLLHALFTALEARGYRVAARMPRPPTNERGHREPVKWWPSQHHARATCVAIGDQDVLLTLREAEQRVTPPARRSLLDPRHVMVPSGRLVLTIPHHVGGWGQFRQWSDPRDSGRTEARLEAQLNDVVVGIVEAAEEYRRVVRVWRDRVQERERAEAAERARAQQRAREETLEREALRQAEAWQRAALLRAFVSAANEETISTPQGMSPAAWLAWIHDYADRLSPRATLSSGGPDAAARCPRA